MELFERLKRFPWWLELAGIELAARLPDLKYLVRVFLMAQQQRQRGSWSKSTCMCACAYVEKEWGKQWSCRISRRWKAHRTRHSELCANILAPPRNHTLGVHCLAGFGLNLNPMLSIFGWNSSQPGRFGCLQSFSGHKAKGRVDFLLYCLEEQSVMTKKKVLMW